MSHCKIVERQSNSEMNWKEYEAMVDLRESDSEEVRFIMLPLECVERRALVSELLYLRVL